MKYSIIFLLFMASFSLQAADFSLKSAEISPSEMIPPSFEFNGFGCTGNNRSPMLEWQGAPVDTKSFAVTVYDPDAPTGSGWWHWQVINIPASTRVLPSNVGIEHSKDLPVAAVQMQNDYGTKAWGGTCPPKGDNAHRYIFTVHALKVEKLDLPSDATAALTGYMINANTIAKATFTAKYGR